MIYHFYIELKESILVEYMGIKKCFRSLKSLVRGNKDIGNGLAWLRGRNGMQIFAVCGK